MAFRFDPKTDSTFLSHALHYKKESAKAELEYFKKNTGDHGKKIARLNEIMGNLELSIPAKAGDRTPFDYSEYDNFMEECREQRRREIWAEHPEEIAAMITPSPQGRKQNNNVWSSAITTFSPPSTTLETAATNTTTAQSEKSGDHRTLGMRNSSNT